MVKIVLSLLAVAAAKDITLASFDGAKDTTLTWTQKNDPVMGGQSVGTFTVENDEGVFDGTCKIVPFLQAPGFIKAETSKTTLPDVSSCSGLALTVKSSNNYDGFRFSFGTKRADCGKFFAVGHKANFKPPVGEFGTVQIPFTDFTDCWDDATGDAIKTCADDAKYCPDAETLANMETMSVWAEGKEGDVHLEIQSVAATGCTEGLESATPNIVELAESNKDLSTLVSAVVAADLADTLSSAGPFTVFAPTNDAFNALPSGMIDSLMKPENKGQLADILTYHVLPIKAFAKDLDLFQAVKTVEGKLLHVQKWGGSVKVGPSLESKDLRSVIAADNAASNGVVHVIDGVLSVPSQPNIVELAESVQDLSTLVSAVVAADLADTLASPGPFTVFAPTNEGFAALPAGTLDSLLKPENKAQLVDILTYHVLPEQVLSKDLHSFQRVATVEGKNLHILKQNGQIFLGPTLSFHDLRTVKSADNTASNGVVHIIDGVLSVPSKLESAKPNIVELAQSVDDLSTLVTAVVAADLADTLSSPGPFTVFAPTNEAFGALPAGTLDALLKPENKAQLADILTFHVLPQQVLSIDLKTYQRVTTVEGKHLDVIKHEKGVLVGADLKNLKQVTGADNLASNGVAHIIDGVMLPESAIMV